jgi:hypothetical protein
MQRVYPANNTFELFNKFLLLKLKTQIGDL